MGQHPAILKELNNSEPTLHIGGILNFTEPLCEGISENEVDILGWISSRNWQPNEKFCSRCAELYKKGLAWKMPSSRNQSDAA